MKAIVYYPTFPAYRLEILRELAGLQGDSFHFMSGGTPRAEIKPAPASLIPNHTPLRSFSIGTITFEPGIVPRLFRERQGVLIMAPALSSLTSWAALALARVLRMPVFLWGQSGKPGERGIKRSLKEVMNRCASGLLVYGESEARAACELGLPQQRVHIVRNAPGSLPGRLDRQLNFGPVAECAFTLVYVGRLTARKKLTMLIELARQLRDAGLSVGVVVAGAGAARQELEAHAKALDVPAAFLGEVHSESELEAVFARASVVVSPGEVGLLAVQAVSAGVRVVAPWAPGKNGPEADVIKSGATGEWFDPHSQEELKDATLRVLRLVDPSIDPATREEVARTWSASNVAVLIRRAITGSEHGAI